MTEQHEPFGAPFGPLYRRHTRAREACPPAASLAALVQGRVWPWQRRRLVAHLARCPDCADDYRITAGAQANLERALNAGAAGNAPRLKLPALLSGLRPATIAAAASIAAVAIALLLVFQLDRPAPDGPVAGRAGTATRAENDVLFASNFDAGKQRVLFSDGFDD